MLSRHLHVDEVDIDGISREHYGDLKEAALKALLKSATMCTLYMFSCVYCVHTYVYMYIYVYTLVLCMHTCTCTHTHTHTHTHNNLSKPL